MLHPNATAYRQTADAFRSGDLATLASLIDEHVIWHVPGPHQMAGDIRGRNAKRRSSFAGLLTGAICEFPGRRLERY